MKKQKKIDTDLFWNLRAVVSIMAKAKVNHVRSQEELAGNRMTQDETIEYIIKNFKR